MDICALLDDARARCNVLDHPFYQRWSAGELGSEELDLYAGEYRHAVVALAAASRRAAEQAGPEHRAQLVRHTVEEEAHVELWDDFVSAVGSDECGAPTARGALRTQHADSHANREPLAETRDCVATWTAGTDLLEHLAVLYAVEASQPAISTTKLEGLAAHYGVPADSPGAAYFKLHAKLDVEHARQARELIAQLMPADREAAEATRERMLARAQAALDGNWRLLDGVEARRVAVAA